MADSPNDWSNRRIEPLSSGDEDAVKLIRAQLAEIHDQQHSSSPTTKDPVSLIDTFWRQHGHKSDHQTAWQEFYAGLNDHQKQKLWDEYHQVSSTSSSVATEDPSNFKTLSLRTDEQEGFKIETQSVKKKTTIADTKKNLLSQLKKAQPTGLKAHIKPFISAVIVMLVILIINYNPLVIAQVKQYISPGDNLQGPVIIDPNESINIGKESKIIIPKINVDVPVVYDVKTFDENDIQTALERGVVHYGTTAVPGEAGNNVIVGHSSNNFFNSGKYKFAFVLLDRLKQGDTFIIHYKGVRYVYKVTNKQIVEPNDFSLIQPTSKPTTTLITCTPPGTSWRRLIVQGEQISPAPTTTKAPTNNIDPNDQGVEIVPGNAPSLWSRFSDWLFGGE